RELARLRATATARTRGFCMFKWLTRTQKRALLTKTAYSALRLETLEAREVPAVLIQLDYSRDVSGFFNNPDARAIMDRVAHELVHVLGIGTAPQWTSQSHNGYFYGANADGVYGAAIPLGPDGAHWADGLTVGGQGVSLDPTLTYGTRVTWSVLDAAALRDL